MNRRRFLGASLGLGALALGARVVLQGVERVEGRSRALGAEASITVFHEDRSVAERAVAAAFRGLESLENALSLYRPDSALCRLNRDGWMAQPDESLVTVLREARDWARRTGGAFDPTVQPLWELHARGVPPGPGELAEAIRKVDWRRIRIGPDDLRLGSGQSVTLNGIAQGYAADRVMAILREHGIRRALVNAGELGGLGAGASGNPWRIGIQHPRQPGAQVAELPLADRFLATSGDYATRFSEDFSRHHLVDPATGRSPERLASVSVLAPTGLEADALSTAIFVLGPGRGLELAVTRSGVDVLLVLKSGEILRTPHFPEAA
jgi:thiamine biosynthesis lipoprotein